MSSSTLQRQAEHACSAVTATMEGFITAKGLGGETGERETDSKGVI